MKERIFAVITFIIIIGFSVTNSIVLKSATDDLIGELEGFNIEGEGALEGLCKIDEGFRDKLTYIGLTVSHDDLTNIEDCFAEMTGNLRVGDTKGAEVTKSRLISFIEHLRRLVGFNIDNII